MWHLILFSNHCVLFQNLEQTEYRSKCRFIMSVYLFEIIEQINIMSLEDAAMTQLLNIYFTLITITAEDKGIIQKRNESLVPFKFITA